MRGNTQPTDYNGVLLLLFGADEICQAVIESGHYGVQLTSKWKDNDQQQQQVQQQPRTIWRHGSADFRKANQLIEQTDWDTLLPEDDIDLAAVNWTS